MNTRRSRTTRIVIPKATLLRAFRQVDRGRLIDEVSAELGISRSTFSRMRRRLVASGEYDRPKLVAPPYRMADLQREMGLTRKSICNYIEVGLLAGPGGFGSNASYGEDHLLRLQLITLLKRAGMTLDEMVPFVRRLGKAEEKRLVRSAGKLAWTPRRVMDWIERERS